MTVCIACRFVREDGTVITRAASDSEVSYGNRRLRGLATTEKVIQFNGASVAASGSGVVFEALDILKSDEKYASSVQFKTRAHIRMFAIDLFEQIDSLIEQAKISREEVSTGVILVTTEDSVWAIFQDLSVFPFNEYFCSGSGADTAMGLMIPYYKQLGANATEEDLECILTEVIKETCALELGCGEPVRIYSVLAPNPPVKAKTKKRKVLTEAPSNDKLNQVEGVSKSDKQSRSKRHRLP